MGRTHGRLRGLAQPQRRAHFAGNGLDHLGIAFFVRLANLLQQRDTFINAGAGETRESSLGRRDRLVHVLGVAQHDLADDLLGGGIDNV